MKTLSRRTGRILPILVLLVGLSPTTARGTQTPDALDALLAPIALYPDALLFQVLAAAEHPLDVVRAERWAANHPHLSGEDAVQAAANENWDPSVLALVAFPQILSRMSEELEWTEQLGAAVGGREDEVLDSVQRLRQAAHTAGHLESTDYVRVVHEGPRIVLVPAQTHIIHMPYYNPHIVFRNRPWAVRATSFWPPPPGRVVRRHAFWYSGPPAPASVLYARFHWDLGHMVINVGHPPVRTPYAWHRPPAPRPAYRPRPSPRHPVREPRMSRPRSPRVGAPSPSRSRSGRGTPDEYRRHPEPGRSRRNPGGTWNQTWGVSRTRSWEQTWGGNRSRTWDRTWDRSEDSRDDTPRSRRR